MGQYLRIGDMLVRNGKITAQQLAAALSERTSSHQRIGEVLVALGLVSEWDVAQCLAEQYGFEVADPSEVIPDPSALSLIPGSLAATHRILVTAVRGDAIECIMADPLNFPVSDMISRLSGKRAVLRIAPVAVLVAAIRKAYGLRDRRPAVRRRLATERPAPKPQTDRSALLEQLDCVLYAAGEPTAASTGSKVGTGHSLAVAGKEQERK